jgi:hypothetical protein
MPLAEGGNDLDFFGEGQNAHKGAILVKGSRFGHVGFEANLPGPGKRTL